MMGSGSNKNNAAPLHDHGGSTSKWHDEYEHVTKKGSCNSGGCGYGAGSEIEGTKCLYRERPCHVTFRLPRLQKGKKQALCQRLQQLKDQNMSDKFSVVAHIAPIGISHGRDIQNIHKG